MQSRDLLLWQALPKEDKEGERSRLHAFLFCKTEDCEKTGFSPLPLVKRDQLNGYGRRLKEHHS